MDKTVIKKMQMGFISLSALAVLAACGNGGTQEAPPAQEDSATEEPAPAPEEETTQDETGGEDTAGQDEAASDQEQGQDAGSTETADTSNGIYNVEFQVTLDDAIQTFYDTYGEEVTIDQIDFDDDNGSYEYDIDGWDQENEYSLEINADTGEVTEQSSETDDDQDDALELENIITPQEAMDAAVQEAGSEMIDEWTLEEDDGMTVYEIDFNDVEDVTIDAATGDIIPD
jgi:uncharacterized membrane protein YkoI